MTTQAVAELAPWVRRFCWSPAAELHPTRREALLPGLSDAQWSRPGVQRQASRHLIDGLSPAERLDELDVEVELQVLSDAGRLAVLPQAPLERLATRLGFALGGPADDSDLLGLDADDRSFAQSRARLYWRGPRRPLEGGPSPRVLGWMALRRAVDGLPDGWTARFEWKTPVEPGPVPPTPSLLTDAAPVALCAAALRILKEFETPWSSLFANIRR